MGEQNNQHRSEQGGTPQVGARVEYSGPGLTDAEMTPAPWPLVSRWMAEAVAADEVSGAASEPNTLDLATVDASGMPDLRPVLMKLFDPRGPGFITDAHSAKAQQLATNPVAAVTLRWARLFRTVRMRGVAEPIGRDELQGLWAARPRGAQVAAWTSLQSQPVADRAALEAAVAAATGRFDGVDEVPMPDAYVGWRVRPVSVEVWAGRESRLHDRVRYTTHDGRPAPLDDEAAWAHTRLQP